VTEFSRQRVAIIPDWLTVYGGAERVLEQMLTVLPLNTAPDDDGPELR
jgi:hypothetical protein